MKRAERRRGQRVEGVRRRERYPWLPWVSLVVVVILALVGAWVIATDRLPPCGGKAVPCGISSNR